MIHGFALVQSLCLPFGDLQLLDGGIFLNTSFAIGACSSTHGDVHKHAKISGSFDLENSKDAHDF